MEGLEVSARTVEEAIGQALDNLGVARSEVTIEVLNEGRSGILGFGAENARVRVTPVAETTAEPLYAASTARAVIIDLLEAMGIEANVEEVAPPVEDANDNIRAIAFDVRGEDLGILIGRRGQTLASLQYLVNLIVNRKLTQRTLIIVDIEGYRQRRVASLNNMALRLAERVRASGRPITLEPMAAGERRVIHIALHDFADIVTQSIGEGDNRKVSIALRRR
ncbi:MAG: protein jag [Dehalococcoidia bacterium]|nr:protein jag [Dehalococcoidia bacterium]